MGGRSYQREQLLPDLVQEEIRWNTMDGSWSNHDVHEKYSLDGNAKKGKGKLSHSKLDSSRGDKKKDMLKIKCFHYHELRHYATKCPHKKAYKKPSGGERGESLASQFKLDFTLIACMVTSVMGSVWYLDSGASFHMTGNKEFLSDLEEKVLWNQLTKI